MSKSSLIGISKLSKYRGYSKSLHSNQVDKNIESPKSHLYKGILFNISKNNTFNVKKSTKPLDTVNEDIHASHAKLRAEKNQVSKSLFDTNMMIDCHEDSLELPNGRPPTSIKTSKFRFISDVSRYHSHQTFIPAEELFDLPTLSNRVSLSITKHLLSKLKKFQMPVLSRQIEASMSEEFGVYITATPWNLFMPFNNSLYEAARMVQERFMYENAKESMLTKFPFDKNLPIQKKNLLFIPRNESSIIKRKNIIQECDQLYDDIATKSYSRYCIYESKVPGKWDMVLQHAANAIGKNPSLHPIMKSDVMNIITRILSLGEQGINK